jgi:hypothetical protein
VIFSIIGNECKHGYKASDIADVSNFTYRDPLL